MKTFSLNFDGYWSEANKSNIPNQSGIYCVYSYTHNKTTKTNTLNELLYIGESKKVQERLSTHERLDEWLEDLTEKESLCYSFAPIAEADRKRAEAALIYKHQPPYNIEHVDSFSFDDTAIKLTGKIRLLYVNFTCKKTN